MESQASVKTKCDGCGKTLGSSYPNKRGAISLNLKDGTDDSGYENYNRYDYCGESCLATHLGKRAKASEDMDSMASVTFKGNVLELDMALGKTAKK
jgi:hypothetical protein